MPDSLIATLSGFYGVPCPRVFPSRPRPLFKHADAVTAAPDVEFENKFAQKSYEFVSQQAPSLFEGDYFVGFQVVKKSKDNQRAVGVFGFSVGKNWVYIPVFLHKGKLQGYNLMYLSDQNQFVPLTETWVNHILARKPVDLGHPVDKNQRRGMNAPDYLQARDRLLYGGGSGGTAFGKFGQLKVWSSSATPKWSEPFLSKAASFFTQDAPAEGLLPKAITRDFRLCKNAFAAYRKQPGLESLLDAAYGTGLFKTAFADWIKQAESDPKTELFLSRQVMNFPSGEGTGFSLRVRFVTSGTEFADPFDDTPSRDIRTKGYYVDDRRKDDEVSYLLQPDSLSFSTPQGTGFHDLLMADGSLKRVWIYLQPCRDGDDRVWDADHRHDTSIPASTLDAACFEIPENGEADAVGCRKIVSDLLTVPVLNTSERESKRIPVSQIKRSRRYKRGDEEYEHDWHPLYALFDASGQCRGVFFVDSEEHDEPVQVRVFLPDKDGVKDCELIVSEKSKGQAPVEVSGTWVVPSDCEVMFLGWTDRLYSLTGCGNRFGTPGDLDTLLFHEKVKTASLSVNQDRVYFNGDGRREFTKRGALKELIENPRYYFREEDAREILAQAEKKAVFREPHTVLYKTPLGKTAGPGDPDMWRPDSSLDYFYDSPEFREPYVRNDPDFDVPVEEGFEEEEELENPRRQETDDWLTTLRNTPAPDPMAVQLAAQAAGAGRKDVMDVAVIAAFLEEDLDQSVIEETVRYGLQALNQLGKLILQMYWRYDTMLEYYGSTGLPEIEYGLVNTFEDLGDLLLKLRNSSKNRQDADFLNDIDLNDTEGA